MSLTEKRGHFFKKDNSDYIKEANVATFWTIDGITEIRESNFLLNDVGKYE